MKAECEKMTWFAMMAWIALAMGASAVTSGYSAAAALDTRGRSQRGAAADEGLDTRSIDADWSESRDLDTRKPFGTVLLMR